MVTIQEVYDYIDSLAPFHTQEGWDNSGFLVGDGNQSIRSLAVILDITPSAIATAKKLGIELIVSHHPVIFKPQSSFIKGNLAYELAANGISVICAHTNLDAAQGGVNDLLAAKLGLQEITAVSLSDREAPLLRMGILPEEGLTPAEFAEQVREALDCPMLRYVAGKQPVKNVVVCGGSGGSFLEEAVGLSADAYVTGDASHHDFLKAAQEGITFLAAGHFHTEDLVVEPFAKKLANRFQELQIVRLMQKDPVTYCPAPLSKGKKGSGQKEENEGECRWR